MALSIEEAFRPCAAVAYNLAAEFGDDSYEADLANLRAYGHAVLARAVGVCTWCSKARADGEVECATHAVLKEEIDNLGKEASELDRGGASMSEEKE